MTENPYRFVGDYFYQTARKESLDTIMLRNKFKYTYSTAMKNRKNFKPEMVFIIRDGLSEGQYQMVFIFNIN